MINFLALVVVFLTGVIVIFLSDIQTALEEILAKLNETSYPVYVDDASGETRRGPQ